MEGILNQEAGKLTVQLLIIPRDDIVVLRCIFGFPKTNSLNLNCLRSGSLARCQRRITPNEMLT